MGEMEDFEDALKEDGVAILPTQYGPIFNKPDGEVFLSIENNLQLNRWVLSTFIPTSLIVRGTPEECGKKLLEIRNRWAFINSTMGYQLTFYIQWETWIPQGHYLVNLWWHPCTPQPIALQQLDVVFAQHAHELHEWEEYITSVTNWFYEGGR